MKREQWPVDEISFNNDLRVCDLGTTFIQHSDLEESIRNAVVKRLATSKLRLEERRDKHRKQSQVWAHAVVGMLNAPLVRTEIPSIILSEVQSQDDFTGAFLERFEHLLPVIDWHSAYAAPVHEHHTKHALLFQYNPDNSVKLWVCPQCTKQLPPRLFTAYDIPKRQGTLRGNIPGSEWQSALRQLNPTWSLLPDSERARLGAAGKCIMIVKQPIKPARTLDSLQFYDPAGEDERLQVKKAETTSKVIEKITKRFKSYLPQFLNAESSIPAKLVLGIQDDGAILGLNFEPSQDNLDELRIQLNDCSLGFFPPLPKDLVSVELIQVVGPPRPRNDDVVAVVKRAVTTTARAFKALCYTYVLCFNVLDSNMRFQLQCEPGLRLAERAQ